MCNRAIILKIDKSKGGRTKSCYRKYLDSYPVCSRQSSIKIRIARFRPTEASINLINVLRAPASSGRVAGHAIPVGIRLTFRGGRANG